jgi:hypothetical protein
MTFLEGRFRKLSKRRSCGIMDPGVQESRTEKTCRQQDGLRDDESREGMGENGRHSAMVIGRSEGWKPRWAGDGCSKNGATRRTPRRTWRRKNEVAEMIRRALGNYPSRAPEFRPPPFPLWRGPARMGVLIGACALTLIISQCSEMQAKL